MAESFHDHQLQRFLKSYLQILCKDLYSGLQDYYLHNRFTALNDYFQRVKLVQTLSGSRLDEHVRAILDDADQTEQPGVFSLSQFDLGVSFEAGDYLFFVESSFGLHFDAPLNQIGEFWSWHRLRNPGENLLLKEFRSPTMNMTDAKALRQWEKAFCSFTRHFEDKCLETIRNHELSLFYEYYRLQLQPPYSVFFKDLPPEI